MNTIYYNMPKVNIKNTIIIGEYELPIEIYNLYKKATIKARKGECNWEEQEQIQRLGYPINSGILSYLSKDYPKNIV